jgi:hypothetical protein
MEEAQEQTNRRNHACNARAHQDQAESRQAEAEVYLALGTAHDENLVLPEVWVQRDRGSCIFLSAVLAEVSHARSGSKP